MATPSQDGGYVLRRAKLLARRARAPLPCRGARGLFFAGSEQNRKAHQIGQSAGASTVSSVCFDFLDFVFMLGLVAFARARIRVMTAHLARVTLVRIVIH